VKVLAIFMMSFLAVTVIFVGHCVYTHLTLFRPWEREWDAARREFQIHPTEDNRSRMWHAWGMEFKASEYGSDPLWFTNQKPESPSAR
jgi:hypothetical protein